MGVQQQRNSLFAAGCSRAPLLPGVCADRLQRMGTCPLRAGGRGHAPVPPGSLHACCGSSDSAEPAPSASAWSVLAGSVQSARQRVELGLVAVLAGRELRWLLLLFVI